MELFLDNLQPTCHTGGMVKIQISACIESYQSPDSHGYPRVGQARMSRVVLAEKLGRPIKAGHFACHHCDNPRCVNPEHLYEGTQKENMRDRDTRKGNPFTRLDTVARAKASASRKSRGSCRGERHNLAKLDDEKVRLIRKRAGEPLGTLAKEFGVAKSVICNVIKRRTWAHVSERVG